MDDGETLTAVPLVTVIFPGVITPFPPLKTPVRMADPPVVIVVGLAVKLVIFDGTGFTVTVTVFETAVPAEFVTVSVYVVVADGVTLTAVPLVAVMFPGVITPVPPLKTPVRMADPSDVIVVGLAVKLVIFGETGFTVTVTVFETAVPAEFVTVSVYVVVADGVTLTPFPLLALMFPGVITPVPPLKTPVRLADPPAVIEFGLAVKPLIIGAVTAACVTVTVAD